MKRLTWLVGPPGAGKSTYAATQSSYPRRVEFTSMLGPLVNPVRMRKGILGGHSLLVQLIRHLEMHPENLHFGPLLVVAGLVSEEALYPLSDDEEVILLLPERQRWEEQLLKRPVNGGSSGQYDDYDYSRLWYDRFCSWETKGLPLRRLEVPFEPELLGQVCQRNE